jgi:tRNA (cytidine/uridine-2'-O-)-methyltransferase
MFHIVLFQPEIPPNTGNIIRLCANVGARLHLIRPLGFSLDERRLRRAGLDYHELTVLREHPDLASYLDRERPERWFGCSTRGATPYSQVSYRPGDALLFGPETRGLPAYLLADLGTERSLRIPMCPGNRSLNIANAVSIVLYEAWRQHGFQGAG